jgi:hypothetical protein
MSSPTRLLAHLATAVFALTSVVLSSAPAQAGTLAAPSSAAVDKQSADKPTLVAELRLPTQPKPGTPNQFQIAAEVCTTYSPGVNVIETATGKVVYTQHLNIQYCYDGVNVTRLTAPSFTDVLILDPRISILLRLPISASGNPPTTLLDSTGSVNIRFQRTLGQPVYFYAQVFVRAVVNGLGGQASASGIL